MDSTINGKTVHINNPLDLIGLGRREIEFNIHKADYWEMFKETMQVPTMKRGGYKNLLKGGWVFVDPFNQGRDLRLKTILLVQAERYGKLLELAEIFLIMVLMKVDIIILSVLVIKMMKITLLEINYLFYKQAKLTLYNGI